MTDGPFLGSRQAAELLGVQAATLYAYVSRGMLTSEPALPGSRKKRYRRQDVLALKQARDIRHNPVKAVQGSLHWGAPVLDSAITCVDNGRLYYRGHDVLQLARERSFEQVVSLIWSGELKAGIPPAKAPRLPWPQLTPLLAGLKPLQRLQCVLPLAAAADPARHDRHPAAVARMGSRILRLAVRAVTGSPLGRQSVAVALQKGLGASGSRRLLDAALILCADHELNVSAFTVRCAASAGSTPYDAVLAGLAALRGPRHGGHTARVEALFDEAARCASAESVVQGRLARGELLPGFGHPLYPEGDPRGRLLLELLRAHTPEHPELRRALELCSAAHTAHGSLPAIDVGLVALRRVLGMADGAAICLFGIGRLVGWLGHIQEQLPQAMIRPRARYQGPPPQASQGASPAG